MKRFHHSRMVCHDQGMGKRARFAGIAVRENFSYSAISLGTKEATHSLNGSEWPLDSSPDSGLAALALSS